MIRKYTWYEFNLLEFIDNILCDRTCHVSWRTFCVHLKRLILSFLGEQCPSCKCLLFSCVLISLEVYDFLLIFSLVDLSIVEVQFEVNCCVATYLLPIIFDNSNHVYFDGSNLLYVQSLCHPNVLILSSLSSSVHLCLVIFTSWKSILYD